MKNKEIFTRIIVILNINILARYLRSGWTHIASTRFPDTLISSLFTAKYQFLFIFIIFLIDFSLRQRARN